MPVLAGILQSLWRLGRVSARSAFAKLRATTGYSRTFDQWRRPIPYRQCRAGSAVFLDAGLFDADLAEAARPSTASRPASKISSENSPVPAIRDITTVPIMVARLAIACLRAALRGTSRI